MSGVVKAHRPLTSRTFPVDLMVRPSILAVLVMLATLAFAIELFRYRGAAKDGGTLEYVFEAGDQNSHDAVTKEKAVKSLPIL